MTLTTPGEDRTTEFRAGTLNDLLEAAKGGRPEAAADVARYRAMAIGGLISSAILAVALVISLVTGGDDGGGDQKSQATTTTVAPLAAPPGTRTTRVSLAESRVPPGLARGSLIGLTDGETTVENITVLGFHSETLDIAGTRSTRYLLDVAVNSADFTTFSSLNKQTLQGFGGEAPTTTTTTALPPSAPAPAPDPAPAPPG